MLNPIKISESLLTRYLEAVGDTMCGPSEAVVTELAKAEKYFKAPPANKGKAVRLQCTPYQLYSDLHNKNAKVLTAC
jgi:hypothetical protein